MDICLYPVIGVGYVHWGYTQEMHESSVVTSCPCQISNTRNKTEKLFNTTYKKTSPTFKALI